MSTRRRQWLALAGGGVLHHLWVGPAAAQAPGVQTRVPAASAMAEAAGSPAPADNTAGLAAGTAGAQDDAALAAAFRAAVQRFTGGAPLREGRVRLTIPQLVENGNAVPVSLAVPELPPGTAVRRLALFTQRNPQPEVAVFALGPGAGRAEVHTRIRLATSQGLLALAELDDGSCWQQPVDVVVTMAACVEGG